LGLRIFTGKTSAGATIYLHEIRVKHLIITGLYATCSLQQEFSRIPASSWPSQNRICE